MKHSTTNTADELQRVIMQIPDGATVATTGSGGGLVEPDAILAAFERSFLEDGRPADLTLIHALGMGDGERTGTNRFAHSGMVGRVIGGHWSWSPRMLSLLEQNRIQAYALPSGVIVHLLREVGAGRPGLITKVGMGTYVDPRMSGGKVNDAATDDLVEIVELGGEEFLRYLPLKVDVGVIRGTYADEFGNIYTSEEAADLDGYNIALAAANCGGVVIAQVREFRAASELRAREVLVPGHLVDHIHSVPEQQQTYMGGYDLSFAGLGESTARTHQGFVTSDIARRIVAGRAANELKENSTVNFGFGMSADVALSIGEDPSGIWTTIEQGLHNGELMNGDLFGMARRPNAIVSSAQQFDCYSGGGLDQTFLGMAEFDAEGNVNVSHLGATVSGPGGFIDISQGAKDVIFCGRFRAGGVQLALRGNALAIDREGGFAKAVRTVKAVTFSGPEAAAKGQRVLYITERAVFRLAQQNVELVEVAPGIDVERDVLDQMEFAPVVKKVSTMPINLFRESTGEGAA